MYSPTVFFGQSASVCDQKSHNTKSNKQDDNRMIMMTNNNKNSNNVDVIDDDDDHHPSDFSSSSSTSTTPATWTTRRRTITTTTGRKMIVVIDNNTSNGGCSVGGSSSVGRRSRGDFGFFFVVSTATSSSSSSTSSLKMIKFLLRMLVIVATTTSILLLRVQFHEVYYNNVSGDIIGGRDSTDSRGRININSSSSSSTDSTGSIGIFTFSGNQRNRSSNSSNRGVRNNSGGGASATTATTMKTTTPPPPPPTSSSSSSSASSHQQQQQQQQPQKAVVQVYAWMHIPKTAGTTGYEMFMRPLLRALNRDGGQGGGDGDDDGENNGTNMTKIYPPPPPNPSLTHLSKTGQLSASQLLHQTDIWSTYNTPGCASWDATTTGGANTAAHAPPGYGATHCSASEIHDCLVHNKYVHTKYLGLSSPKNDNTTTNKNNQIDEIDVKFLTLIRNPIERVLSEYYWFKSTSLQAPMAMQTSQLRKPVYTQSLQSSTTSFLLQPISTSTTIRRKAVWTPSMHLSGDQDNITEWILDPTNVAHNRQSMYFLMNTKFPRQQRGINNERKASLECSTWDSSQTLEWIYQNFGSIDGLNNYFENYHNNNNNNNLSSSSKSTSKSRSSPLVFNNNDTIFDDVDDDDDDDDDFSGIGNGRDKRFVFVGLFDEMNLTTSVYEDILLPQLLLQQQRQQQRQKNQQQLDDDDSIMTINTTDILVGQKLKSNRHPTYQKPSIISSDIRRLIASKNKLDMYLYNLVRRRLVKAERRKKSA